jgi:transcription-repair coupling factor (superfamily II helicase)
MLPLAILDWLDGIKSERSIFVARDEGMMHSLARAMPVFAPAHQVMTLPAWDNLPYDRARPSRQVTGTRVATLTALAQQPPRRIPAGESATKTRSHPRLLLLTTPEALVQRVPPEERIRERAIPLEVGQELDPEWLRSTLLAFGYGFDDRVEEPGEAALHGGTMDIHLAGTNTPIRLELEDGRIISMRWFDPISQRSQAETSQALLIPTTEAFTVPGESLPDGAASGREPLLPEGPLATMFDYLTECAWASIEGLEERCYGWLTLIRDAHEVAKIAGTGRATPLSPDRLYLTGEELRSGLASMTPTVFAQSDDTGEPGISLNAVATRVNKLREAGEAVIFCVPGAVETLRAGIARRLRTEPAEIALLESWQSAVALPPGAVGVLRLDLQSGFHLPGRAVLPIRVATARRQDADLLTRLAGTLHIGDLVVEPTRGLARLKDLTMEEGTGAPTECLRLAFHGQSALLVPCTEANRIWRYGSSSPIKADRLDASNWQARCAEVERGLDELAMGLVQRMEARNRAVAPVIEAEPAYGRFARRRPYPLTPDQVRAVRAVQQDLARGSPMMRLVCGDVGYGKTEVALHAAALVAASGRQVAIVAPTTLLAVQHLEVFRRQLGSMGLRIEGLIRSSRSPENQALLRDLQQGTINIVVGTQAVAAARFRDLGLVVIDEEQRFGEAQKRRLRELQGNAHSLIMTGTPLPRSLQSALSGLIEVSVLSTPPAARQPGRTFVTPLDPVIMRASLLRETRRGGQGFVVCPRVEDIPAMHDRLREFVPEIKVAVAHGRLRGEALDKVMLSFAEGKADVLLSTSIIEAGLDLPNANTMLIWRADRFGLAQLHQLRGRVGRGRERATTYLLTDPAHPPSRAGRKRLETLATLDSLGAGFALSLADLDQRGAGDLLGDAQSGHVWLFGTELYRDMLERALARARGEPQPEAWRPEIVLDVPAFVPPEFVPEPDERLGIYRQLASLDTDAEIGEAADDLADRFGELPEPVLALLDLARLRIACRRLGIERVQAGPNAVALTVRDGAVELDRYPDARASGGRLLLPITEPSPIARLAQLLDRLSAAGA